MSRARLIPRLVYIGRLLRAVSFLATDFAISVVLGAAALWLGCLAWEALASFVMWHPIVMPGWFTFRVAVVLAAAHQVWRVGKQVNANG